MEKSKKTLNVTVEVKAINYQNGNVMEASGKLKTVFGGRDSVADEDSLRFKGSDCGKSQMEVNYNSTSQGTGEKTTDVELEIKGKILNSKKELIDVIAAHSKLTKADSSEDPSVKTEDLLTLKIENGCDTKCATSESYYTTKTSEIAE